MLFTKTVLALLGTVVLVAAAPRPMTPFSAEMCHGFREPCDRQDQCCPGLQCNLNEYECQPRRATQRIPEALNHEMCHGFREP
ncbi:hypothetical protein BGZ89_004139, partial [Linnemannia elongata]